MKIHKFMIAAALAMCCAAVSPAGLHAGPARRGIVKFVQPDGSTFDGYVRGDEFCHFKTTLSGQVIAQDSEGWWCLASYSADGKLTVSTTRAGSNAPALFSAVKQEYPRPSARRAVFDRNLAGRRTSMRRFLSTEDGTATKAGAVAKQKHGIVILAAFSDVSFNYSRQYFVDMLTKPGYSYNDADGSALDYFNSQFGGLVDFSFDVSEIVKLPKNRAYYGGNDRNGDDKNPEQMVIDACKGAAERGVDFSKYDDDNDGYVDNVFIFFSGGDEADGAGDDCIWSHAYYIESGAGKTLELNGKRIDSYACTSELTPEIVEYGGGYAATGKYVLAGIGTFCHEYSHTFGLPDLYDTDYDGSGGKADALWYSTGLMDGGNANNSGNTPPNYNAIDREILGLGNCIMAEDGNVELEPIEKNGTYCRIDTQTEGEYFLIECRDNSSWDKHIGGKGLLVYHIDKSSNKAGKSDSYGMTLTAEQRWYEYNEVNCRPDRQCADLIEANPSATGKSSDDEGYLSTDLLPSIFFPYGKYDGISSSNGLSCWSGDENPVRISGIKLTADGTARFSISGVGTVITKDVFQNSAIINVSNRNAQGEITVACLGEEMSVPSHAAGKYSALIGGLQPGRKYTAKVTVRTKDGTTETRSVSFTTAEKVGTLPRIGISTRGRNIDGSFRTGAEIPLVIENAPEGSSVTWYFNDREITAGESNCYSIDGDGVLKAVIQLKDGSETVIRKKIVTR